MLNLTYKYRLKGKRISRIMSQHAYSVNQVWNFCVATQKQTQRFRKDGLNVRWLSKFDYNVLVKGTSKDLGIHAQTINSTCEQFTRSRDQHKKCPKYRKSGGPKRSLGWIPFQKQSRQINAGSVTYLGHIYRFFGSKRRPLPPTAKGGCFVEDAMGRWWVCFDIEIAEDKTAGTGAIGIDLGLKHLATMSDGSKIEALKTYRVYEKKLAVAQRAGNKRRAKAIHAKIANIRSNHLHQTSAAIVKANNFIAVGDVSSSQLARTRFAKSVLDAGWSTFRNQLRYKASRHGAIFVEVDEKFTTQTCSHCGDCATDERPRGIAGLGIRQWQCFACGTIHDRDVNAARNILMAGLSVKPRVDESRLTNGL